MFYVELEENEIVEFRNKNLIENYDMKYFDMLSKFVSLSEMDGFYEVKKYANLSNYYVENLIDFDFENFEKNLDFLKEHVLYFRDLFDNLMNLI